MFPKSSPPPFHSAPHRQAFHRTRRQLALWYTGVTTLILLTAGAIIYGLIVHARWLSLEKEMQTLAVLIENQLEPVLTEAGQFDQTAQQRFPDLCFYASGCGHSPPQPNSTPLGNLLSPNQSSGVCVRLVDPANRPVVWLKLPSNLDCKNPQIWQQLRDAEGHYYHRLAYPLHTQTQTNWGKLQIVQSLNDFDLYMLWVEVALVAVIGIAILAAGVASWQLAKLAMQPVQYSYQQMEQFTADAAHELRSPLASLRAIVQTALRSQNLTPQETQETLQILNRQSQRLSSLVQDLLLFSQIGQTQEASNPACCLNQLVTELTDEFMPMALAAQIELTCQIQISYPVYIIGNSDHIHRAVANLINNALNYTITEGIVTVLLTVDSTHALIHVQDSGIGIAPSDQARIFDRFYRVAQARSWQRGGSGLGLAIAQSIVQSHRGSLTVQSQLGHGSCFTIRLPLPSGGKRQTFSH